MSELNYFLSDQFIEFSKKIAEIHEQKKNKTKELKKIYEEFQSQIKDLENQANVLAAEFEEWKKSSA